MKERRRRAGDAEQNRSNWDKLLEQAKSLLGDSKALEREIQGSTDRIEEAWDATADDVERTQQEVSRTIDSQASHRQAEASFDESEVAGPPGAVSDGDTVHGDPDLPGQSDYELEDPVSVEEVETAVAETEQQSAIEPETPIPFTEKDWFELHSEQFPISEDLFPIDVAERTGETETDDAERRREEESTGRRDRDRDDGSREDNA